MKRWLLACLLLVAMAPIYAYAPVNEKAYEQEVFELINRSRTNAGLPVLKWDDVIADVAREHSRNMAKKKAPFSHAGFDERIAAIRKDISGGVTGAAENIAYGQMDGPAAVKLWLNSKGHRKNIMANYIRSGIGIAEAKDGTIYLTQIFIR